MDMAEESEETSKTSPLARCEIKLRHVTHADEINQHLLGEMISDGFHHYVIVD